jgi:hypothetical protein
VRVKVTLSPSAMSGGLPEHRFAVEHLELVQVRVGARVLDFEGDRPGSHLGVDGIAAGVGQGQGERFALGRGGFVVIGTAGGDGYGEDAECRCAEQGADELGVHVRRFSFVL